MLNFNSINYEFALPRKEISTGHGYTDFIICSDKNLTVEEDFIRRDSTINAIGFPIRTLSDLQLLDIEKNKIPQFDKFIDPHGGISDIKNKIWKCVEDPKKRFIEDSNRIMRAFRQSSELNLEIESNTLLGIEQNCHLMKKLIPKSYSRFFNELLKMLLADNCKKYLQIMNNLRILEILGIQDANLNIGNSQLVIKFASLLSCHKIKDIDTWLNERNIASTTYLSPLDCKIIKSINKYYEQVLIIDSQYSMCKILATMILEHINECNIVMKHIIDYLITNEKITEEKYSLLVKYLELSQQYPINLRDLDIDGWILMKEPFNYKNTVIMNKKLLLQDKIFKNELVNKKNILIDYLLNN